MWVKDLYVGAEVIPRWITEKRDRRKVQTRSCRQTGGRGIPRFRIETSDLFPINDSGRVANEALNPFANFRGQGNAGPGGGGLK